MRSVEVLTKRLLVLAVLLCVSVSACGGAARPKNVIFIIGDGMGIGAITAVRCATSGADANLVLDTMPVTGLVKTHSGNSLVTDSAASGTALATGHKTNNGCVSVDSNGNNLPTILELADTIGKSTGVITTDLVTGATPAVFYSHVASRDDQDTIAAQLLSSRASVAMGGGKNYFVPKSAGQDGRSDGRNLLGEAKAQGFDVALDAKSMINSSSKRLLGLFSFDESGPTLQDMLNKSLSVLSTNPKGFFIMAESCLPDKGGHSNNIAISVNGVTALDKALLSAMNFAKSDHNTLVVVTADHETGGLSVLHADDNSTQLKPGWVTTGHTGSMVAVYAFGPGSEKFAGTHDNTEIPKIFADLWGKKLGN